jgi:ABC-2 type transport system ATP-binding protein/lipopolysaccharide transport system ATP-binding protein
MTIELTLQAKEEVDDFAVGVGVFNTDGVCCYGTNTDIERFEPAKLYGTATVRMEIPTLNLIEGTYYLDLAVHRVDGYPYDYQRGLTRFRTTSPIADTGVARLPHRWSFAGGIEWKKTPETDANPTPVHKADPEQP